MEGGLYLKFRLDHLAGQHFGSLIDSDMAGTHRKYREMPGRVRIPGILTLEYSAISGSCI